MAIIDAINTIYIEKDVQTVEWTSLGSYDHLQIRGSSRTDNTVLNEALFIQMNSDTTNSNYSCHRLYSYPSGAGSYAFHLASVGEAFSNGFQIIQPDYSTFVADIYDYRNSSKFTFGRVHCGYMATGTAHYNEVQLGSHHSTSAVTSIKLKHTSGQWIQRGSSFTLYGIKDS